MNEELVQRTASDAARAKTSMSRLGYYDDPFIQHFLSAAGGARCSPLINRGYYARYKAIDAIVRRFITQCKSCGVPSQIVVFGGGSDTMYLRFLQEEVASGSDESETQQSFVPTRFVEFDLLENSIHKVATISRSKKMCELLGVTPRAVGKVNPGVQDSGTEEPEVAKSDTPRFIPHQGVLHTRRGYSIVPCDLRDSGAMTAALASCDLDVAFPTLFLSECVLIYLESKHADSAISWASSTFLNSVFVTYEQIGPDDPFGRMMVRNLNKRGCGLRTIHDYPTIESQVERYTRLGFGSQVVARDMNYVYNKCIDPVDRRRIEKLELFDEFEEWRLIQGHYFLAVAIKVAPLTKNSSEASSEDSSPDTIEKGRQCMEGFKKIAADFLSPHGTSEVPALPRPVSPRPQ